MGEIVKWADGGVHITDVFYLNITERNDICFHNSNGLVIDFDLPASEETKGLLQMVYPSLPLADFVMNLQSDTTIEWTAGINLLQKMSLKSVFRAYNYVNRVYVPVSGWRPG